MIASDGVEAAVTQQPSQARFPSHLTLIDMAAVDAGYQPGIQVKVSKGTPGYGFFVWLGFR